VDGYLKPNFVQVLQVKMEKKNGTFGTWLFKVGFCIGFGSQTGLVVNVVQ